LGRSMNALRPGCQLSYVPMRYRQA
jgi:hypothetical protein